MSWRDHPRLVACTGLIAGPALWALGTELGLILPYAECHSPFRPLLISGLLTTALVLAAGYVSWNAPWPGRTGQFAARTFALMAALLAFSMLLQSLASAMLTGCER